jgi:hypothetical protein
MIGLIFGVVIGRGADIYINASITNIILSFTSPTTFAVPAIACAAAAATMHTHPHAMSVCYIHDM